MIYILDFSVKFEAGLIDLNEVSMSRMVRIES